MTARTSPRFFRAAAHAAPIALASALVACSGGAGSPEGSSSSSAAAVTAASSSRSLIREIEDHRLPGDPRLKRLLASPDPSIAEAAAIAVGRIGDPSLEADVAALLGAKSARVRGAAALSLGLLGGGAAETAIDARIPGEHDAATLHALLVSLGQVGSATSLPLVTAALAPSATPDAQTAAAEAYGTMVAGGVAPGSNAPVVQELLTYAGEAPELRATAAAYALSKLAAARGVLPEAALTAAFLASPAASARGYLASALGTLKTTTSIQALATATSSDAAPPVRAQACGALATAGATPVVLDALSAALHDPSSQVVVGAVTAIGTLGATASPLLPALDSTFDASQSAWVRATLVTTLVAVDAASARARVAAGLKDAWPVQLAAIGALPALGTAADLDALVTIAGQPDKRLAAAAVEAMTAVSPSLVTPALKTTMRAALARKDWEITASVADVTVAFGWKDFAPDLDAAYDDFPGEEAMNGRLEIVYALGSIGSAADLPVLERGILDDEVLVSTYAAMSYQQVTGTDVSSQVRLENVVTTPTPSAAEVDAALRSLVVLETTRGPIVLRMLPEAPLNATSFVRLVQSGVYDGLPFHRVVPNFVAQGGDPRGDGSGGSKHLVRDELSSVPHLTGTVGLATEGKDTGSSQFFFNEAWNVHLDLRYTLFAEVVFGMDAAERLEVGDAILSATALTL